MIESMISAKEIAARVAELGAEISRDYAGETVVLLGTLKGAVIFLADLARAITVPVEMDFIKASSYGNDSASSGKVKIDYAPETDFSGRHIILVEDIVDMGYTAVELKKFLLSKNPASVKLCSLLDKPDRRKAQGVVIDYLGFSIEDKFVVGYGLDYAQQHRNLPYVGIVNL